MTTVEVPEVGAAGFLAALASHGLTAVQRDGFAIFEYAVEVGGRAGEQVKIGLLIPADWPLSPPPGPHISPRLGHPGGAVTDSTLGSDWEYWSRPASNVGIIGAGSVGALVADALARVGIEWITLLDFDTVEAVNLDRLLHAGPRDVRLVRAKVEVLSRALRRSATAEHPRIEALDLSVVEPEGLARALDCDVLFSCVDRPWPRAALNLIAYAHLVPVVDGGILVRGRRGQLLRSAEWRAHLAAPGRACLECLGQYDPGLVQVERAGLLDDPSYLAGLDDDHPLRRDENVFPFSAAAAAAAYETLQLLTAVIAPGGVGDVGAHLHHFTTGTLDRRTDGCLPDCPYTSVLLALADTHGFDVTAEHPAAVTAREARRRAGKRPSTRLARKVDDLLWRLIQQPRRSSRDATPPDNAALVPRRQVTPENTPHDTCTRPRLLDRRKLR